ncbi:DUF6766 family protein [Streptomyces sp. NPDC050164]|uniref:DUF6766 family protein n=1 Tax=Streptomyces sp. NPDC050164 TaxID=3365605 RepID=UPI0037A45743
MSHNSLGLFSLSTFLLALAGQAMAGHAEFNNQLVSDGMAPIGLGAYLTSSDFAVDVTENWQSEYLQFFLSASPPTPDSTRVASGESSPRTTPATRRVRKPRSRMTGRHWSRKGPRKIPGSYGSWMDGSATPDGSVCPVNDGLGVSKAVGAGLGVGGRCRWCGTGP